MILKDHINLMGNNPLRGPHEPFMGDRFPDMTQVYDPELRRRVLGLAKKEKVSLREGIYLAVSGPSYETPSEVWAYRRLGADVVGMSVVPETIVAKQIGMKVLGLVWVANLAAGISRTPLSHEEVLRLGERVGAKAVPFFKRVLGAL